MIRKSTFLAVAASAVLGLAMLSVTEASARSHGGGGGGGGIHGGGHGGGMHGGGHGGGMRVVGRRGTRRPRGSPPHHSPALARSQSPPDLVRRADGWLHLRSDRYPRCRPVHLLEQGIHTGRPCALQGPLHQRSGDQPAGYCAAAERLDRCSGAAGVQCGPVPGGTGERAAAGRLADGSTEVSFRVRKLVENPGLAPGFFLLCLETRQHARLAICVARETLLERHGVVEIIVGLAGVPGGRRIQIVLCRFGTGRESLDKIG